MFISPTYLLFALPALLFAMWAQWRVQSTFNKYSQIRTSRGVTGADVARYLLDANGLQNVQIEEVQGTLSDHYDPQAKVLRLSPQVYRSPSISAAGVAAHEMGHALQDKDRYPFLAFRTLMVPGVQIGSWVGPLVFLAGLFLRSQPLALIGLVLFAATAAFALVTLPVEFDASNRAKKMLAQYNLVSPEEGEGVKAVLNAAAFTYVAAALQAISTLLYYASFLMGGRRN